MEPRKGLPSQGTGRSDTLPRMAYDEGLAFRVRELLSDRRDVVEKGMFGGLAFLIGGAMTVGIVGEDLLVRVGPGRHDEALARPHARIMDFTGRPMKGWIFVAPSGTEDDTALCAATTSCLADTSQFKCNHLISLNSVSGCLRPRVAGRSRW